MQIKKILRNSLAPLLAVIIVVATSTFTYWTLRLYLRSHTHEVAARFNNDGQYDINSLDAFNTSMELNTISSQDNWICLIAKSSEGYIFNKRQSHCNSNWRQQSIVLKKSGENGVYVRITLRLPVWMEMAALAFLIAQIALLSAFVRFHHLAVTIKFKHEAHLGQLARQVSHDLRSPIGALSALLGQAENSLSLEHRHLLSLALKRISSIVSHLLETTRQTQREEFTNINQVIREIVTLKKMEYQGRPNLNIIYYDAYPLAQSKLSGDKLKSILSNLISNACEAQSFQGDVHIELLPSGDKWEVTINDDGPGFTPYLIDKIGLKPVSAHKTHGNGIGLYSAYQTLKAQGHELLVQNQKARGACVKIII